MTQVKPDDAATPKRGQMSNTRKMWEDRLNADAAGVQENAESFTKQFVNVMYSGSTTTQQQHQVEVQPAAAAAVPPALPPKTKIMFSPSRHVFSPTAESEDSSMTTATSISAASTVKEAQEFIPVKEKAKMIALQQQEIIRREESKSQDSSRMAGENLKGGVRLLPPSPQTVRKEFNDSPQTVRTVESMETASSTSSSFQYQSFQQHSSTSCTTSGQDGVAVKTTTVVQQSANNQNSREVRVITHTSILGQSKSIFFSDSKLHSRIGR